uniref:mucoidy inhibitor MuiA family protein n=1 Tax=Pelomonas sp. KK5 TaxID=1855730 RepID=UPI0013019DC9
MKKSFALSGILMLACVAALAQPAGRVERVLVYPGGASVERTVAVKAGQTSLRIACLPARFEPDSLQLTPPAGIQLGEISVQTQDRAAQPECATSPLDARIRELEDQRAALAAESSALGLSIEYLKNFGNGRESATAQIAATSEALRRNGLDALQKQNTLARRQQELDRQLAPLTAERDRIAQANPQLRTVTVRLVAPAAGELRLSYRLNQAGWEPVYRAYLDTDTGRVRLERHAQVAQNSGEDWSGVKLRLSTAQPRQATGMPPP